MKSNTAGSRPANLTTGQYLIRVTDSDNSTPKIAPVTITNPATTQISFLVDGKATTRVSPAGFVQVQADVLNNCALCHSWRPVDVECLEPQF